MQMNHALELLETHSYKQVKRLTGISITANLPSKIRESKTATPERSHQAASVKHQETNAKPPSEQPNRAISKSQTLQPAHRGEKAQLPTSITANSIRQS